MSQKYSKMAKMAKKVAKIFLDPKRPKTTCFDQKTTKNHVFLTQKLPQMATFYRIIRHFRKTTLHADKSHVNHVILRNMLQHVNHEKSSDSGYNKMLTKLTVRICAHYKQLTVYLTALGSWFEGYMYYVNVRWANK